MREAQREAIQKARQFAAEHADILRELRRLAGAAGGRASTEAKADAARKNGARGGRPKKQVALIRSLHRQARERFATNRTKCYQRHIRELHAEIEQRPQLRSLEGATVERVTNGDAKAIILKYEWLQTMGSGIVACYGLKLHGELLGVVCFGILGANIRRICAGRTKRETRALEKATACLMRGACVPWAPKNAASFLIRHSCRQASKDFGWKIFFAFADAKAGEIGTVYQAANWLFLGHGERSRPNKKHTDFISPSGRRTLSSYQLNHRREALQAELKMPKCGFLCKSKQRCTNRSKCKIFRHWLDTLGWRRKENFTADKGKYVWFEGSSREKRKLEAMCRYPLSRTYPKRLAA